MRLRVVSYCVGIQKLHNVVVTALCAQTEMMCRTPQIEVCLRLRVLVTDGRVVHGEGVSPRWRCRSMFCVCNMAATAGIPVIDVAPSWIIPPSPVTCGTILGPHMRATQVRINGNGCVPDRVIRAPLVLVIACQHLAERVGPSRLVVVDENPHRHPHTDGIVGNVGAPTLPVRHV